MPFNKKKYRSEKKKIENYLNKGYKNESDFMEDYKYFIEVDDFESAKAISDVLDLLKYDVKWTHSNIECLN